MIDEIQVENLALIRKATLEPARGLTVLTGETGAGKTALLSALKLLMGERADKGSVRDGEDALVVSGRFFGVASLEDAGDGEDAGAGRHATRGRRRPLARDRERPHGQRRRAGGRGGSHGGSVRPARAPAAA